MTASLAAYIVRNKRNPRPEWQRDPAPERAEPFRILPGGRMKTEAEPKPAAGLARHPMLRRRFPLVLMLEPLHACNLTCTGCGRIREYESTITERLPL
jgi:hypothetical protein